MPKTKLGMWSIWLIPAKIVLFLLQSFLTFLHESILAENILYTNIVFRPVFLFSGLLGVASGVSAFVTGITDIIKKRGTCFLSLWVNTCGCCCHFYHLCIPISLLGSQNLLSHL